MNNNNNIQDKAFIVLERLWIGGIAIGIGGVIYFLIIKDNDSALFFFGFFILSSIIYLMRRRQSKKHRAYLEHKERERKAKAGK
jgi:uncharacterized membrane protein YfcA